MKRQHPMKLKHNIVAVAGLVACSLSLAVSAVEVAPQTKSSAKAAADQQLEIDRMVSKRAEIIKRLGMSAPLEAPEAGEGDFVAEAVAQGIIVEVTLEEVVAAMDAAASTPSNEDDLAAMRLAHFGSYRFFLDGKSPGEKTPDSN